MLSSYRIWRCLVPLNDRHFAKLGGGLDKADFYLINFYIKYLEIKIWVNPIFKICNELFKNNQILVSVMKSHQNCLILKQCTKTQNLNIFQNESNVIAIVRRKRRGREGTNWFSVCRTKCWSWGDENAIDFRWSGALEEDEKDIALVNFIESLQKQTDYKS